MQPSCCRSWAKDGPAGARAALAAFRGELRADVDRQPDPAHAARRPSAGQLEPRRFTRRPVGRPDPAHAHALAAQPSEVRPAARPPRPSTSTRRRCRACHQIKAFIAATNVATGKVRIFTREELSIDALLASACLPSIHEAVVIDGEPYWDGGFRGNPPIWPFIYNSDSTDVVIVEVDPPGREDIPRSNAEIADRLDEITFGGRADGGDARNRLRAGADRQGQSLRSEFGDRLKKLLIHSITRSRDAVVRSAPSASSTSSRNSSTICSRPAVLLQPSGWPTRSTRSAWRTASTSGHASCEIAVQQNNRDKSDHEAASLRVSPHLP